MNIRFAPPNVSRLRRLLSSIRCNLSFGGPLTALVVLALFPTGKTLFAQSLLQGEVTKFRLTYSVPYYPHGIITKSNFIRRTLTEKELLGSELGPNKLLVGFEGATGTPWGAPGYENNSDFFFQVGGLSNTDYPTADLSHRLTIETDGGFLPGEAQFATPLLPLGEFDDLKKRGNYHQVRNVTLKIKETDAAGNEVEVGRFSGQLHSGTQASGLPYSVGTSPAMPAMAFDILSYKSLAGFTSGTLEVWTPKILMGTLTGHFRDGTMTESASDARLELEVAAFTRATTANTGSPDRAPLLLTSASSAPNVYLGSGSSNLVVSIKTPTPSGLNITSGTLKWDWYLGSRRVTQENNEDSDPSSLSALTASAGYQIQWPPQSLGGDAAPLAPGRYTLLYTYSTPAGSVSNRKEFNVFAYGPPTITAQPSLADSALPIGLTGNQVVIRASADGSDRADFDFAWYKLKTNAQGLTIPTKLETGNGENGASITVAGTGSSSGFQTSLTLDNISYADAGDYYVVITNPTTRDSVTSEKLTFNPATPPYILAQPEAASTQQPSPSEPINAGTIYLSMFQDLSLSVSAAGPESGGSLSYQWFKNGTAIRGATASTYLEAKIKPSRELNLNPAAFPNEDGVRSAEYQVRVSNRFGSVVSNKTIVQVLPDFLLHEVAPVPRTSVWISKCETSIGQWKTFVSDTGWNKSSLWRSAVSVPKQDSRIDYRDTAWPINPQDDFPVVMVSWDDAQDYCAWLSAKSGSTWRLPTETEWLAAVGPSKYPWGDDWPAPSADPDTLVRTYGNYGVRDSSGSVLGSLKRIKEVPAFNQLFGMGGNAAEWMQNAGSLNTSYSTTLRMTRGGSFIDAIDPTGTSLSSLALASRSATRSYRKTFRAKDIGFRVVLVQP